jgi:tetratricopeptide (TPR) repeat protein
VSVAWFTRLYELNEAGRFDEVVVASQRYLAKRPKDYALHLQRAKALLSLGQLDDARVHLDAAIKHSKGLAAWPWFYRAALHARLGEREPMYEALELTLQLDPRLQHDLAGSPFFAAYWGTRRFKALLVSRTARPGSGGPGGRAPASPRAATRRRAVTARGRTRAGASARRRGGG